MDFGQALTELQRGKKLSRAGWDSKGSYVQLDKGRDYAFSEILPFFVIKNTSNSFNTWLPSVPDLLADDWDICTMDRTLAGVSTKNLVAELQTREGVETHTAGPNQELLLKADGPVVILTVTD